MNRRSLLAVFVAGLAGAVPAVASAAMLWTLVASPLTTTVNQSTTFALTATNLDLLTELGCLEVDLPGSFVIESLGTPVASHGEDWTSTQSGNAVIVRSLSGGGRLERGWSVSFTIRAHATTAGTYLWPNHAHQRQDCTSQDQAGVPLSVTVLPAILPTPNPTPTPTPNPTATPPPTATPQPTATPSPILPLPSIGLPLPTLFPTAGPTATPDPAASADPTSGASVGPDPSTSPAASDGSGATGAGPPRGSGGTGTGDTPALLVARGADAAGDGADVGVELAGLLDGDFVWLVPGASVAVPGLLVILWVVLQAMGALAWIPAVRRMADESGRRRS
jgi:hypothetical protein